MCSSGIQADAAQRSRRSLPVYRTGLTCVLVGQPPSRHLLAVLDQHQTRDLAGAVLDEPGLGIAGLDVEQGLGFGREHELGLTLGLKEQPGTVAGDLDDLLALAGMSAS